MIESMIYGGVGNQLFMYAFGLSQARRLKTELSLNIDILLHNPFHYTPYFFELLSFTGVTEDILTGNLPGLKLIEEHKWDGKEIKDNSLLDGYWQCEDFFDNVKDELRKKLEFKDRSVLDNFTNENTVSIHARRGDYLNGDYFVDLSKTNYYQNAVEHIKQVIDSPTFYIFSNDLSWANSYFSFIKDKKIFMTNGVCEDLKNMSLCKHNITANSTYSWWGAWLNKNPNKIVIQPKRWLKNKDIERLKLKGSILI